MIEGKTTTGFAWTIDDEAADDIELFELLTNLDDTDVGGILKVIERLLGAEQKKALYEHLRNDKGRVPASDVMNTITEIMQQGAEKSKALKNLSSSPE